MSFKKIKDFFALERNIVVLAMSNVILLAGSFIYINFLPKFYEALGATTVIVGLLFTLENGIQQISHLIGGHWSDRYGRKKIYLLSFLIGATALLIFYFSSHWIFLIPAVLLLGFADGIGGTAGSTLITESVHKHKRAIGWSIVQSLGTFTAFVAAPFGGLLIEKFGLLPGFKLGLIIAITTTVIAFIFLGLFLKETLKRKVSQRVKINLKSGINFFVKLPNKIKSYFLFAGLLFFGLSLVQPYFVFYALDIIKINAFEFGILMAIITGVSTIFLVVGGKISDIHSRKYVLLTSVFLIVFAVIVFLLSKSFAHLIFFAILEGIATIGYSSLIPYAADHVNPKIRAKTLGLTNFVMMSSSTLAPLLGGWLYSLTPSFPFLALIGVDIITFFVGWKVLS
jgi:MFS family permease